MSANGTESPPTSMDDTKKPPADKRDLLVLLKLIKKYNLKQTEELLCQEANIRRDELEEVDDKEITSILTSALGDSAEATSGETKQDQAGSDPELYDAAFGDLRNFVDESLDIYKHELFMVLYPILVQIYFKLVSGGYAKSARAFVEKYGPDLDYYYREDLQNLLLITKKSEMENNDWVTSIESDKFLIRMSRDAHSLFKRHIQDRKQELIADIVLKYINFDTYEGTARSKVQCDATSGSLIGEARRQDNKIRVYYGLLKEVDFQSLTTPAPAAVEEEDDNDPDAPDKPKKKKPKKDPLFSKKSKSDPNAPSMDRIPLPELKDADKLEKLKALREASKRVPLNKDSLPSVCLYTILNSHNSVTCAEISEDSYMMAVGFTDSSVKVWSLTPSKLREMKSAEQLKDIDKDAEDVLVRMMDDRTGESARTFYGHSGPVYRCAFAPEKNMLLSCSEDTTIRLWSLHTWTCIVVFKGHLFPVWDVRFSPHGYYFASCSYDKTARLWATDSNQPLRIFTGHLSDVDCVQFHPNSNYIASGSSDRTVRLWDVLTGQLVRLMTGHKGSIYALAFSTCGRYLASGSSDHNVLVWDLSHGQLVTSLIKHTGSIHTMCFSRDGTILAVGGLDCYLTLWDFSKLSEDYISQNSNASHNPEIDEGDHYLLRAFPTKSTPFTTLHFTRRNLLLAVGTFKA
ncbi:TATA-box binding protein associated factor 5 [Haematobia irritans]|uniref:TATA-box binding protein associated factor 5 n=1 Tax=Haematobia irritans TaxID=7368 RepID=UPI003F4FE9D4